MRHPWIVVLLATAFSAAATAAPASGSGFDGGAIAGTVHASPCTGPSGFLTDPFEFGPADTDFTEFAWSMEAGVLWFRFFVPELWTSAIRVNRPGISPGYREYEWGVAVDVDANTATGSQFWFMKGADYILSISSWHSATWTAGEDALVPLSVMQADLWRHNPRTNGWRSADVQAEVDIMSEAVFAVSAPVPGLVATSRLMPFTYWADPSAAPGVVVPDTHADCSQTVSTLIFRGHFE